MDKPLDKRVRAALKSRKGDWLEIAGKAGVSHSWLSKFYNGHIGNPGYATLMKLDAYLSAPAGDTTPAALDEHRTEAA